MYRFAFQFTERVLFENLDDKALFENEHLIEKHKSFHIKGCGVDLNYFRPMPEKPEEDNIRFTFIGRLLYDKGIVEFVEAAKIVKKQYPRVQFTVLGFLDDENPAHILRSELIDWISSGIIQYHGQTEDVRPYINESSCVVLPSYREGLPRVMMEAMAMAKPIITTKTAGCREMVEEGINGFLVNINDVESLAIAMVNIIICSPGTRFKMGLYSRKMAESEFDDQLIATQIISGLAQYV
jgi:glycosyltransferase involved in cell wall biosynthesis